MAIGFATYYAQDFTLDASSDTLLDQNDPQLQYYLSSRERFAGAEDFLVLTYASDNDGIFTPVTLQHKQRPDRAPFYVVQTVACHQKSTTRHQQELQTCRARSFVRSTVPRWRLEARHIATKRTSISSCTQCSKPLAAITSTARWHG